MALIHPGNRNGPARVWVDGQPVDRILCVDTTRNVAVQHVRDRSPVKCGRDNYKLVCRVLSGFIALTAVNPPSRDEE